jgi:hypothetical protein
MLANAIAYDYGCETSFKSTSCASTVAGLVDPVDMLVDLCAGLLKHAASKEIEPSSDIEYMFGLVEVLRQSLKGPSLEGRSCNSRRS